MNSWNPKHLELALKNQFFEVFTTGTNQRERERERERQRQRDRERGTQTHKGRGAMGGRDEPQLYLLRN